MMHWRYLKAVCRHKKFVLLAGFGRVNLWQLLIHDWSKFTPAEWFPYARKFYGGPYPSIKEFYGDVRNMYLSAGCYQEAIDEAFELAWLRHQKRNPHHWQWWVLHEDSGKVFCLPMPEKYRREMVADWRGANRAYGDTPLVLWYQRTQAARMLHPETQRLVEKELGIGGED